MTPNDCVPLSDRALFGHRLRVYSGDMAHPPWVSGLNLNTSRAWLVWDAPDGTRRVGRCGESQVKVHQWLTAILAPSEVAEVWDIVVEMEWKEER